jgi:hypothetical protein
VGLGAGLDRSKISALTEVRNPECPTRSIFVNTPSVYVEWSADCDNLWGGGGGGGGPYKKFKLTGSVVP